MTLPQWYAALAGSDALRELGFRFCPNEGELPEADQIRVGDIGEFGAAVGRGIGLILRAGEPEVLYARFADDHEEGDESTLISQYFVHASNDLLGREEVTARLRELVTPYLRSPHEAFRKQVERMVQHHQLTDVTE